MPSKASILATPSATAEVLGRFGLAPKKHFGQNFLVNDAIVGKILALAQVGSLAVEGAIYHTHCGVVDFLDRSCARA